MQMDITIAQKVVEVYEEGESVADADAAYALVEAGVAAEERMHENAGEQALDALQDNTPPMDWAPQFHVAVTGDEEP
jgi:hypothetical protein